MLPDRDTSPASDANLCETAIQTELLGINEPTQIHLNSNVARDASGIQTEKASVADRETQTDRMKNRRIQTIPCKTPTNEKAQQTLPTAVSSTTQTKSLVKHGKDSASMTHACLKQSKSTATPPPTDKHTQTFQCSSHNFAAQASETFTKGSQTLTKKEIKSHLERMRPEPEPDHTVPKHTTSLASSVSPSDHAEVDRYDTLIAMVEKAIKEGIIK